MIFRLSFHSHAGEYNYHFCRCFSVTVVVKMRVGCLQINGSHLMRLRPICGVDDDFGIFSPILQCSLDPGFKTPLVNRLEYGTEHRVDSMSE